MTVMMQYLFQGFNCRGEEKYKDMLMDIGTEEIGHVEMLCALISQLLDGATPAEQQKQRRTLLLLPLWEESILNICW